MVQTGGGQRGRGGMRRACGRMRQNQKGEARGGIHDARLASASTHASAARRQDLVARTHRRRRRPPRSSKTTRRGEHVDARPPVPHHHLRGAPCLQSHFNEHGQRLPVHYGDGVNGRPRWQWREWREQSRCPHRSGGSPHMSFLPPAAVLSRPERPVWRATVNLYMFTACPFVYQLLRLKASNR